MSTTPSAPLRLLLVDDHAMVREGLMRILERSGVHWQVGVHPAPSKR